MYRLFSDYRDQDKNPYSIFLMYSYPFLREGVYIFCKDNAFQGKNSWKVKKKQERENGKRYKLCSP